MPSSDLVQSLSRGLMLLELLAAADNGLTLQQLCQELDLKSTTVHNLLRTLMARGYVEKLLKPTRYTLGNSMMELVDQYRNREIQRLAAKAVSEVFARLNYARVTYAEAVAGDVVLKLRITPERPGLLERPWHSVMLPYVSASVLLFQAFWNEDTRNFYRQRYPFETYGAYLWQTEERFQEFLSDVRNKGYADPPVDRSGLVRVAVPVFNSGHELVGALGAAINVNLVDGETQENARKIEAMKTEMIASLMQVARKLSPDKTLNGKENGIHIKEWEG